MNGLKITILQGTTLDQKKEYFFDRKHQSIVIGCDPETCDISFPEHYRDAGVGNEHIAFKRSLGRYQVDLNTDNFVLINGEVPFEDQEITGTAKVQLGENVLIEIEVVDQRKQPHQTKGKNPQPGEQIKGTKRYLRLLFMIIIGLFAAAVYFSDILNNLESNIQVSDENIQRVTDRLQNLSSTLIKIETQTDGITRATIDTVSRSVYLVLVRNSSGGEQPTGTAWVIEGGRLVTNAHVARIMETLKSDEEMIVRSPVAPYRSHAVKETLIHPGYTIFNDIWEDYLPCQKVGNKLGLFRTINPADVAILYVEDNEGLSSPLPLATMDELASIEPGMAVAFVGYPSESLLPGNNKKPVPVAQQDEIIRITDFFQTRQNELPNRLIHHGLPVTGGASGSPMFDAEGKVIGVISSMNVSPGNRYGARSPNAADVNFGQRIDFLFDLFSQDLESRMAKMKSHWEKSLKDYLPGFKTSNQAVLERSKGIFSLKEVKSKKTIFNDIDWTINDDKYVKVREKVSMDRPGLYLIRLQSRMTTSKLKVSPPGEKNISVCAPKIDFSNFAKYAFVLVGEPGEVSLSFQAARNDEETIRRYQFDLTYWDEDLDLLVDSLIHYFVTKDGNEIEIVKKVEELPMAKEIKNKFYAGFEIELQKKGNYIFSSVACGRGELNAAVFDANNKLIDNDKSSNGLGLVTIKKNETGKQKVNFISYSKNKNVVQNMIVYFSPSEN